MTHDECVQFRLISLYCLLCGHQTARVRLRIAGLTRTALRAALAAEAPETQPRWNAKLEPLCTVPRCPGRLILEIGPIREPLDNDVPANAFAAGVDCGRVRNVVIEPEVATDVPA